MFRKPPNIKPFSPVRSSDRRKLLTSILVAFDIPAEALAAETKALIVPSDIQSAKFTAHTTGEHGLVYVGGEGNRPLWLRIKEDRLVPTVFMLWQCPFLLPIVHTWSPVIEKLRNGADMMLPGLIPPFQSTIHRGSIVAIASADRPTVPLAVGICEMDLASITRVQGQHGKAVLIIQCYGDGLPVKGKVSVPVELELELPAITADTPVPASEHEADAGLPDVSVLQVDSENVREMPQGEAPQVESAGNCQTTVEIDDAFRAALLFTIREARTVSPLTFPQPSSTFISAHLLRHLPVDYASATMKQTSWKKAIKFLRTMEKEGLVKIKEKAGDATVTGIAGLEHAAVKEFREYKTVSAKKTVNVEPSTNQEAKLTIKEYYQIKDKGKAIAEAVGKKAADYYTIGELRLILLEYIAKEDLVSPSNPREIKLDPVLAHLTPSSPKPRELPREALIDRFRETCSPYYRILRQGEDERGVKLARGTPAKVQILITMKQGHKVTRITNLETYKVDIQDLANELRTECASSTTVNRSLEGTGGGGQGKLEIQIQGPQSKTVTEVLERHGVRKTWIEVKDTSKKK